ncbi:hypothetical protein [Cytophaga aurantiaca]|uniref:hypothetical protein n=1 Tax=Cytophaga aurantiaca TaxID=29530 RepID=UPI0012F75751|nr:hypothetical protein [Cytophaga aurantiaca]
MQESDSTNIFSSYSDEKLRTTLDDLSTLDSTAIVSLKQEFMNREMFEESFAIDTFFSAKFDPSKLSLKEIQKLVSDRLQTGESIQSIKLDLADHGITFENLINKEAILVDAISNKIANATDESKDEAYINAELKKEYNFSDEEIIDVKKNIKGRNRLYVILAICVTLFYLARFILRLMMY